MRYLLVGSIVLLGAGAMLAWGRAVSVPGRSYVAAQFRYQPVALGIAAVAILLSNLCFPDHASFLAWGDPSAPTVGLGWLGASTDDTWQRVGLTFLVIMTAVTALVAYLQVGKGLPVPAMLRALPLALVFATVNSLAEELLFRVTLAQTLAPIAGQLLIALLAATLFGIPHWFGTPGKIPGVLLAGFMGYFLTLSILQTGGIAWAWGIHLAADVVIMVLLIGREAGGRTPRSR